MTNILIIDDDDDKFAEIVKVLEDRFGTSLSITREECLAGGVKSIASHEYNLIIVDLLMPILNKKEDAVDVTDQLVDAIRQSSLNVRSEVVALSAHEEIVESRRVDFAEAGIVLVHYSEFSSTWKEVLSVLCQRVKTSEICSFVILCALPLERQAYQYAGPKLGKLAAIGGLDCLRMTVGEHHGVCVLLPRMGIVDAAAITARAIELFDPKVVAMSGICAGLAGRSKIGDIICVDLCWEHQAGKWSGPTFKLEEYQVPIDESIRTTLRQLVTTTDHFRAYRESIPVDAEVQKGTVHVGALVSGSVVVSSDKLQEVIADQHKRILGLDMEVYGVARACQLAKGAINFVAVKTVVDLADERKNDGIQPYGAALSAKIISHIIPILLEKGL